MNYCFLVDMNKSLCANSYARLAQLDRASDSYIRRVSEGCEFDPRGGLLITTSVIFAKIVWYEGRMQ